jgi:hypothetical protein
MPKLVRRLRTTTLREAELSADRVRGAINWPETFASRAATGLPHLYATYPARRAYNTPENALLSFVLQAIAEVGAQTGWHRSASPKAGVEVARRVNEALRWRQVRMLADVTPQPPTQRTLNRMRNSRSRRTYATVLDAAELYRLFVMRLDREAVRSAIEDHALVTSRDSVLLELLCAFNAIDSLSSQGWKGWSPGLVTGNLVYQAHRGAQEIKVFYQHAPPALTSESIYRETQRNHEFPRVGGMIPDLVIRLKEPTGISWVLLEVKGGPKREVMQSARAAATDLLAYRRAFDATLSHQSRSYGVGIAWGAAMPPATEGEIRLCTPDTLGAALEAVLSPPLLAGLLNRPPSEAHPNASDGAPHPHRGLS